MGKHYREIPPKLQSFIAAQRLFFVATAAATGRVNLSPKGMDSLRVLSPRRVVWLNLTGSGNETSAHLQIDPRMTLMFCAFSGPPTILRVYGEARVVHQTDTDWAEYLGLFPRLAGARQIFELSVDLVATSCGMGVPLYDYVGDRDQLLTWAESKGKAGIEQYWETRNQWSLDGEPTGIVEKNLGRNDPTGD